MQSRDLVEAHRLVFSAKLYDHQGPIARGGGVVPTPPLTVRVMRNALTGRGLSDLTSKRNCQTCEIACLKKTAPNKMFSNFQNSMRPSASTSCRYISDIYIGDLRSGEFGDLPIISQWSIPRQIDICLTPDHFLF